MFPIADDKLSIPQIADYWAREICPPASPAELQILIEKAWWRGELVGDGASRLTLLRAFHQIYGSEFPWESEVAYLRLLHSHTHRSC
jgi:hypothetical protein